MPTPAAAWESGTTSAKGSPKAETLRQAPAPASRRHRDAHQRNLYCRPSLARRRRELPRTPTQPRGSPRAHHKNAAHGPLRHRRLRRHRDGRDGPEAEPAQGQQESAKGVDTFSSKTRGAFWADSLRGRGHHLEGPAARRTVAVAHLDKMQWTTKAPRQSGSGFRQLRRRRVVALCRV